MSWPLRGILRCGQCGRPMSPSISGYKNLRYRYYRCRSEAGGKPACKGVSVPAQEIEQFVVQILGDQEFRESLETADGEGTDRLQALFRLWPQLPRHVRWKALPRLIRQVVYDQKDSTITVSLDAVGIEEFREALLANY